MDQRSEPVLPDPWHDPEFSRARDDHKPASGLRSSDIHGDPWSRAFPSRSGTRTWVLILVLASVWCRLLGDPMIGPVLLFLLMALGLTLGVLVAAMGLGWMGIGLFAAGDRLVAWFRAGTKWPED